MKTTESKNNETCCFNGVNYNIEQFKLNYRACIPLYLVLDQSLSANELRLYCLIEQMESSCASVYITDRKLANILNVSHESKMIQQMARKLKKKKYIKREEKLVIIKGKKQYLSCWSIVRNDVFVTEEPSVAQLPHEEENSTAGVAQLPPPSVAELHPCNTHEDNKNKNINNIKTDSSPAQEASYQETYFPMPKDKPLKTQKTQTQLTKISASSSEFNLCNLSQDSIEQYLEVRASKKAPLTPIGWKRLQTELMKCDDPQDAFDEMITRGWVGFKKEWLKGITQNKRELDHSDDSWAKDIDKDMF